MRKISFLIIIFFFLIVQGFAQEAAKLGIANLKYLERAYPDLTFIRRYDKQIQDWNITIKMPGDRTAEFYWANGSMLPESELKNADKYWPLLYSYQKELADPANFTEEERERIKQFSSTENRQNGAGTPMFFFDALYDSSSRARLESHIKRIPFLGNLTNVHERMLEPLARVEKRIYSLAESTTSNGSATPEARETKEFLSNLKSNDAYFWRIINGTNRKSFHSLGIAIDILPKKQGGKQIFWDWARDKYPNTWMLIPLKDRWMPPLAVIKIFEEEGFIWGGKWVIYDNMHFEYHPELIQYNFYR